MKVSAVNQTYSPKITSFKSYPQRNSVLESLIKAHKTKSDKLSVIKPLSILKNDIISERQKLLKPLTDREYNETIKKVFEYDGPCAYYIGGSQEPCSLLVIPCGYEEIDDKLKGLIAYCGRYDISNEINRWITARDEEYAKQHFSDERMKNVINTLDYSLKKLDEKHGKYQGIVYRSGYFNPNKSKQYYSTSFIPQNVIEMDDPTPLDENEYSIIKVKNGHNIYKFQREADSDISNMFAFREHEILIDKKSKFRQIPKEEYTEKDKELIENFLFEVIRNYSPKICGENTDFDCNEFKKQISIWEEI